MHCAVFSAAAGMLLAVLQLVAYLVLRWHTVCLLRDQGHA